MRFYLWNIQIELNHHNRLYLNDYLERFKLYSKNQQILMNVMLIDFEGADTLLQITHLFRNNCTGLFKKIIINTTYIFAN